MKALIDRVFADAKVRFVFVGILNNAVAYAIYAAFIYFGLHYAAALFISNVFAVFHSYLWNKYFTFKSTEKSRSEIIRFLAVYGVIYLINTLILFVCVDIFGINAYWSGIIALAITTAASYLGHKKITFRGRDK
ncbi:MAG TPA: GtrA family protein [Candidatus Goldiibacteriota bacterium]|nr:GtrA family protein [Candidatus Goldiibacteriota bacterium]